MSSNYIINPSWFYVAQVLNGLATIGIAVFVTGIISFLIGGLILMLDGYILEDYEMVKVYKLMKFSALAVLIGGLIMVFVPTRDTFIKMKIAEITTYENVELLVNQVEKAADYIVQQIK